MKQEVCLLPIRCKGCGTVFDLWHDLQQEQEDVHIENNDFRQMVGQNFCWHCRKVMTGEPGSDGEPTEEPDGSEEPEGEETQSELKLSFSYE